MARTVHSLRREANNTRHHHHLLLHRHRHCHHRENISIELLHGEVPNHAPSVAGTVQKVDNSVRRPISGDYSASNRA